MNNEEKYPTVKDRIADTFMDLLKDREFNEITVVDIVNTAQAGRISFYRNFTDKDDILRYYVERVTSEWLSKTDENYITLTKESIKPYIIWLFEHMYEYRHITDILMRDGKMHILEDEFDKRFFARLSERSSSWRIVYEVGGVYKLFYYWVKTGYALTPHEVAELVMK